MAFNLFGGDSLNENTPVALTPIGKQKADSSLGNEGARAMVVSYLAENEGVSTPREIGMALRIDPRTIKNVILGLKKAGYVKIAK